LQYGRAVFQRATSVNLIIARHLARKLCSNCKQIEDSAQKRLLEDFPADKGSMQLFYGPVGCENYNGGYKAVSGI
jgi:type IV pilus assembly protein PilB